MPKKTQSYRSWQQEKLTNPRIAADYLNAALGESREGFLDAVKAVVQAHQVAKIAREAGIQRETIYRSLSSEGNPTLDTLFSVLEAVGIQISFAPVRKPKEVKELCLVVR